MHRDYRLYLDDILEAVSKIRDYVAGLDYASFIRDTKTQDARKSLFDAGDDGCSCIGYVQVRVNIFFEARQDKTPSPQLLEI